MQSDFAKSDGIKYYFIKSYIKSINCDAVSYDTLYYVDSISSDVMIYWTMTGTHVAPDRQ